MVMLQLALQFIAIPEIEQLRKGDLALAIASAGGDPVGPAEKGEEIRGHPSVRQLDSAQAGRITGEFIRDSSGGGEGVQHDFGRETPDVVV